MKHPPFVHVRAETMHNNTEEDDNGYAEYKHFMDQYGPLLVGKDTIKSYLLDRVPEFWISPTLEAFGLVSIENYNKATDGWIEARDKGRHGKFCQSGNARRNKGYTNEGYREYTRILELVKKNRTGCIPW